MDQVKSDGRKICATVEVDSSSIDVAIEKANRLVELLREASAIIDSLSGRLKSEP